MGGERSLRLNSFFLVLCAIGSSVKPGFECDAADDLSPYRLVHRPWRSHRVIREAFGEFDENRTTTFNEIQARRRAARERIHEVRVFIDNMYRANEVDRVRVRGHLTVVNTPWSTVSVTEPWSAYGSGCASRWWTPRAEVSVTSRHNNCLVAMNAGFFKSGCLGSVVSDRRVVHDGDGVQNAMFGIRDDGRLVVGYLSKEEIRSGLFRQLVTGVVWLVRNGTSFVEQSAQLESAKHEETGTMQEFVNVVSARTAMGYDSDGRVLLLHIEGQTHQHGVNLYEFADILIEHGFVEAVNLDGGGSATTVVDGVLSSFPSDHCHNPRYRCERKVTTVICVHEPRCYPANCNGHGTCVDGQCSCRAPWTGISCEKLNCSQARCSGRGICRLGQCDCIAGWAGPRCNQTCPKKRYGPNCSQSCPRCGWMYDSKRVSCDAVNGTWHCAAGWQGKCCSQGCNPGWYGPNCLQRCQTVNCSGQGFCSSKSGRCMCEAGWTGRQCESLLKAPATTASSGNLTATVLYNRSVPTSQTSAGATNYSERFRDDQVENTAPESSGIMVPMWVAIITVLIDIAILAASLVVLKRRLTGRRQWGKKLHRREADQEELLAGSGEM